VIAESLYLSERTVERHVKGGLQQTRCPLTSRTYLGGLSGCFADRCRVIP
jgi:hypothetical protein